jgi:hypothetical protein
VRGISDRLEAVEDRLDALGKSSAKVKASTSATKAKSTKAKSAKPKSS